MDKLSVDKMSVDRLVLETVQDRIVVDLVERSPHLAVHLLVDFEVHLCFYLLSYLL